MVDRSVVVKLIADNGSFDAAMTASGTKIEDIGTKATDASTTATKAFSMIKTAAVSVLGLGALKAGQDLINLQQSAQIAFTSITGSAQAASDQVKQIYEWDQNVPVPFQNALASAQKLAAFGLPLQQLIPTLQGVADATGAVGGTADTFDRIVLALGQIQTKGKLSGEEMLQLAEAGLPAWQILAEQLGTTVPDAMKQTEKGAIDANTAISALVSGIEQKFPGAAEQLKSTTAGAWQSIQAGIRDGSAQFLQALQGPFQQSAATIHDLFVTIGDDLGKFAAGATAAVSPLLPLLGGVGSAVGGIPGPVLAAAAAMTIWNAKTDAFSGTLQRMRDEWTVQQSLAAAAGNTYDQFGLASEGAAVKVGRFGNAMGVARAGFGSFQAAGSSLVGFFGGPWGIAITAATLGLSLWGQAQQDAKQKEADHQAQLQSLKDTLDQITGSLTAATAAKYAKDWVDDGTVQQMKDLGLNANAAIQAVVQGGPAMDSFKKQLIDQAAAALQASRGYQDMVKRNPNQAMSGQGLQDFTEELLASGNAGIYSSDQMTELIGVYKTVVGAQSDLSEGSANVRDQFDLLVGTIGDVAGVSNDKLLTTLRDAYASGTDLKTALDGIGISGKDQATVINDLGSAVQTGADGMLYLTGAANSAGAAMSAAGDGAAAGADKIVASTARAAAAMNSQLQAALAFRQSISGALTGFVDPMSAWDAAVDAANPSKSGGGGSKKSTGKSPAVKAAEAALAAGKKQADATKKSAKAEQDAAVKAAAAIRDATKARADADLKATKAAEKNAKDRAAAAKKEADDLKRIADDAAKQATDAQSRLESAQFAKRAADIALQAAQAGLASAKSPEERASWERAVADALKDQGTATQNLAQAQSEAAQTGQAAAAAQSASAAATADQTQAENDYQDAQDKTAQVSEQVSARKSAADDTYTTKKEQADTRYQKSVDAVNSKLDALTQKQDEARQSAQNMATGAAGAVGGMAKKVQPSLDQYLTQLQKQVTAQQTWYDNILTLSQKLGPDVAAGLINLGPSAAPLVQELVNGTDTQLQKFAQLFPKSTDAGVQGMVNSLVAAVAPSQLKAAGLSDAVIQSLMDGLTSAKTQQEAKDAMAAVLWAMQQLANTKEVQAKVKADLDKAESDLLRFTGDKRVKVIADLDVTKMNQDIAALNQQGWSVPLVNNRSFGRFATGGFPADGLSMVGEAGPEWLVKSGSRVQIIPMGGSTAIPAPAPSGPSIVIQQTNVINYPQGAPPAVATNRELASAAALGGLM